MILDPLDVAPVLLFRRRPHDTVQRRLERQVHSRARGNEPQRPAAPRVVVAPFAILLPGPPRKQRALVSSDGFTPAQQPAEPVRAVPRHERHRQLRPRAGDVGAVANLRQPRALARKLRVVENRIRRPVKLPTRRQLDPAALEHRPMERRATRIRNVFLRDERGVLRDARLRVCDSILRLDRGRILVDRGILRRVALHAQHRVHDVDVRRVLLVVVGSIAGDDGALGIPAAHAKLEP
mmetsp:Transcript_7845/g.34607  ORF Transcript_7845/g.34607 Transcript_7845/m.34607 type:complete len:237 (-) Transcript_7845:289-999(-)